MSNEIYLELMPVESSFLYLMLPATSTATFYSGKPPIEYLRMRVQKMIDENPWLEGRLVRRGNDVVVKYPAQPKYNSLFIAYTRTLSADLKYEDFCAQVSDYAVKIGRRCLDKNEALFRIVIMIISEDKFAIFLSMSHVIADGQTFYNIYGMLDIGSSVYPLIATRVQGFEQKLETAISGGNIAKRWSTSPGAILNIILTLLFSRRVTGATLLLNDSWIHQQKSAHAAAASSSSSGAPPFISTNDIVTSWFLRAARCGLGLMAVDFRRRADPGCTAAHAGNYEGLIAYQPADFAAPALIRRSVAAGGGFCRAVSGALPGLARALATRVCLISNWAGFYRPVRLAGCEQVVHVPCIKPATVSWTLAVLYRPTDSDGALALLVLTRCLDLDWLRAQPPLQVAPGSQTSLISSESTASVKGSATDFKAPVET